MQATGNETIQDCIDRYEQGEAVVIIAGKVVGFVKEDN